MSQTKRFADMLADQQEAKRQIAIEIALETGVLTQCEHCDTITHEWTVDLKAAYKRANQLITQDHSRVAIFKGNRTERTDLLQTLPDDYDLDCLCDRAVQGDD